MRKRAREREREKCKGDGVSRCNVSSYWEFLLTGSPKSPSLLELELRPEESVSFKLIRGEKY